MAQPDQQTNPIPATTTIASRKPRRSRQLSSTQVMFAVILAIGLMMAIQFSSRINAERDLANIRDTLNQEIDLLRREEAELTDQLDYVASDAYVEEWAREEARMIRPGETLIIPIPSTTTLAEFAQETVAPPTASLDTTLPDPAPWQMWWYLFFDAAPPALTAN
jgi:cell division protein FtsB